MRELARTITEWNVLGTNSVVARAISVSGFGGRRAGEAMAVAADGTRAGSLLGGAADAEVTALAGALTAGQTGAVIEVPVGDREAVEAGLGCGGLARLLVQDAASLPESVWACLANREPFVLATALPPGAGQPAELRSVALHVDAEDQVVVEGDAEIGALAVGDGSELLRTGRDATRLIDTDAGSLFLEAFVPPSRVTIIAEPSTLVDSISAQATLLGWEATVLDEAAAALVSIGSLGPRDALVVLSHDHELGTPALAAGLGRRCYVGALGSRHTQQARRERLAELGFDTEAIARIHGPIGLDIGSRTPEETAVSIFAEILAARSGRDGRSLRDGRGPING
jgi:xanthine dehydrogenase accessory factor